MSKVKQVIGYSIRLCSIPITCISCRQGKFRAKSFVEVLVPHHSSRILYWPQGAASQATESQLKTPPLILMCLHYHWFPSLQEIGPKPIPTPSIADFHWFSWPQVILQTLCIAYPETSLLTGSLFPLSSLPLFSFYDYSILTSKWDTSILACALLPVLPTWVFIL